VPIHWAFINNNFAILFGGTSHVQTCARRVVFRPFGLITSRVLYSPRLIPSFLQLQGFAKLHNSWSFTASYHVIPRVNILQVALSATRRANQDMPLVEKPDEIVGIVEDIFGRSHPTRVIFKVRPFDGPSG
jgi:hypothetical protein